MLSTELLTKACLLHLRKITLQRQNAPFVACSSFDLWEGLPRRFHSVQNRARKSKKPHILRSTKGSLAQVLTTPASRFVLSFATCTSGFKELVFLPENEAHTRSSRKHNDCYLMEEVGTLPLNMITVSLKQRGTAASVCLELARKRTIKGKRVKETHPLMLPVHAAEIKSSISSVNKSTRADRFCWNNSWVTNRKQLVQPICRKIQRLCQRKSCWKWCFHLSQRIVSQAKVLLFLLPYQLPDMTAAVSTQMPWPKRISWRSNNKKKKRRIVKYQ